VAALKSAPTGKVVAEPSHSDASHAGTARGLTIAYVVTGVAGIGFFGLSMLLLGLWLLPKGARELYQSRLAVAGRLLLSSGLLERGWLLSQGLLAV
jgi:hypothetical protein